MFLIYRSSICLFSVNKYQSIRKIVFSTYCTYKADLKTTNILSVSDSEQSYFKKLARNETDDVRKSRLIYQSRKRGNLENGILLSSFVDQYIDKLNSKQLADYDALINLADNDWDLYYWITGKKKDAKEAPDIFKTDVLDLLKEHSKNKEMKLCNNQPPLKLKQTDK